jgi:hypothetical protein
VRTGGAMLSPGSHSNTSGMTVARCQASSSRAPSTVTADAARATPYGAATRTRGVAAEDGAVCDAAGTATPRTTMSPRDRRYGVT